jgi:hypothetical protein
MSIQRNNLYNMLHRQYQSRQDAEYDKYKALELAKEKDREISEIDNGIKDTWELIEQLEKEEKGSDVE